ncbi:beta-1,4-galactosyltransferase 4-like [Ylistrum balloti]|uniref:beta-1,4-galactosyltransferase 4-like n=1 Tax=Ylistrum balloti TaxID=509963 RepID=UPI002905CED0|nr:beta-1,4-galactosyltransferase 4-like [Ylistrum balloti]
MAMCKSASKTSVPRRGIRLILVTFGIILVVNGFYYSHEHVTGIEISKGNVSRFILNDRENGAQGNYTETTIKQDGYKPDLPVCYTNYSALKGRETLTMTSQSLTSLESIFPSSHVGGRFKPTGCRSKSKIAIILPFRDRETHLKIYLFNVIPKLIRQNVDFTIYVVEQAPGSHFNRGMMRNVGFAEASKIADYDCFIFNDVDSIFEDDRNIFKCGNDNKIRHLVTGVDVFNYKLKYSILVGGIIAFTPQQFRKVNGYSNFYFDWGAEDDDIYYRIQREKMEIERPDNKTTVGFMSTLKHTRDPEVHYRFDILYSRNNVTSQVDGINSLKYTVKMITSKKLFTWIYVSVDENEVLQGLDSRIRRKISAYRGARTKT